MKFTLALFTILAAFSAQARPTGYVCTVLDPRAQRELSRLNLPNYLREIHIFSVAPSSCGKVGPMIYSDFCQVAGNTIGLGLGTNQAEFRTRAGKLFEIICDVNGSVGTR